MVGNEEFDADEILRDLDEKILEEPEKDDNEIGIDDERELKFGNDDDDNESYNEIDVDEESDILE